MKFSLIYGEQLIGTSLHYGSCASEGIIEQVQLAEKLGFDTIWTFQHDELSQDAQTPARDTFLRVIVANTKRIGIGYGVDRVPVNISRPANVAKRVATFDILSKGRLCFGMGLEKASAADDAPGCGMADPTQVLNEAACLIPKLMTQHFSGHHDENASLQRRGLWPDAYQRPHPPMHVACSQDNSLVTAGSAGLGALIMSSSGPIEVARKNKIYRDAFGRLRPADQVGFRPTKHLAAICPAIVLSDGEEARRIGLGHQRFSSGEMKHFHSGALHLIGQETHNRRSAALDDCRERAATSPIGKVEIVPDTIVTDDASGQFAEFHAYGNVENAIAHVQRIIDAGADEVLFLMRVGDVPHWAIMETIRNIGCHVIPALRREDRRTSRSAA